MMATKHLNRKEDGDNGKYETPNQPPAENPLGFLPYIFEGGIILEEWWEETLAAEQTSGK